MAWIVEEKDGKVRTLPVRILNPIELKATTSELAWKILQSLAKKPSYPKELSKKLKTHEQKIYYHVRNLEKAKIIEMIREERRQGAVTKFYSIKDPAFALTLKPLEPASKLFALKREYKEFLEPFITEGKFNAIFVMGDPEPHGPTKERGHDGICATNLALFFGTFLNYIPESKTKLDTELTENDLKENLILIGGPGVNAITAKVNLKLPIRFQRVKYKNNYYTSLYSTVSGKTYTDESYGIIVKVKNPWNKEKYIMIIAGRKFWGTKAAVLAFTIKFDELCSGNSYDKNTQARIVDGLDLDNDGEVDFVEFLE